MKTNLKCCKIILVCLLLMCILQHMHSQNYVEVVNFGSVHSPANEIEGANEITSITESYLNVTLPKVLNNKKDVFIGGINFNSLSFSNKPGMDNISNDYYGITVQCGYIKQLGPSWKATVFAFPRFASDFKDISGKDFQPGGALLLTFKKNENFSYAFGVYYNREFFGHLLVPVLGIDWQPNQKTSVFGNLPINVTVDHKLTENISAGFYFQASSASYRLGKMYQEAYLQKLSQEISFYLDSYITRSFVFTAKLGYSLGREYQVFADNDKFKAKIAGIAIGEQKLPLNRKINDGLLFELKLACRISTKN